MDNMPKKKKKGITRRAFIKGMGGGTLGASVATRIIGRESSILQTETGKEKVAVYTKKQVTLSINGKKHTLEVEPRETLLSVLRERLHLTGTKRVCNQGECGGCTVLLGKIPVYACHFLAVRADGKDITTVEGLSTGGKLHPVQRAFIEKDAYQCGFCTPGFIMSSVACLEKNKNPNVEDIKAALSGNLCRCGNYLKIYEAVSAASESMGKS